MVDGRLGRVARGARKIAAVTLEIGKNAIAALIVEPVQFAFEKRFEIHHLLQYRAAFISQRTRTRQPL